MDYCIPDWDGPSSGNSNLVRDVHVGGSVDKKRELTCACASWAHPPLASAVRSHAHRWWLCEDVGLHEGGQVMYVIGGKAGNTGKARKARKAVRR